MGHRGRAIGAALLSMGYAMALFHRTAAAVIAGMLAVAFDVGLGEASRIATVFFWTYALMQLPCGIAADLIGSRRLAIAGCIATGAGSIAFALAHDLDAAVAARAAVAAGCSVTFVTLMRYIKENWAPTRVATISGRGILIGNLGAIASAAPLTVVLAFVDWRTLSALLGAASLALAAALTMLTSEGRGRAQRAVTLRGVSGELRAVFSNPYNHLGFLILGGLAGAYYALVGLWAIPMLQYKGVPPALAAWGVSAMIAGYALGATTLGWLGDRTRRRGRVLALACSGALSLWALLVSGAHFTSAILAVMVIALGFCCGAFNLVYAIVTEYNPVEHAGTATSYINVGIFAGAAMIQTLSTRIWAPSGNSYEVAMLPMAAGAAVALVGSLVLLASRQPRSSLIETKALASAA
ncbi:MAG: MFS transporter [Rhodospirillaceae bacterium]